MTARADPNGSVLDRIKQTLVGLRMPRALEMIDATVRQLERGELSPLEAIEGLLAEEFSIRENRRVKTALVMARLSTIKTLAGFDFTFQPSLDRNRVLALCPARLRRPPRGGPPARPSRHRQEPPRDRARGRGGQGRAQRLLRHAGRPRRRARPRPSARAGCATRSASSAAPRS